MSTAEFIAYLIGILSFTITVLGYFTNKWISSVEDSIKLLDNREYKNHQKVFEEMIGAKLAQRETTSTMVSQAIVLKNNFEHITKQVDKIEKISEKIIKLETNVENLGKVIVKP